MINMPAEEYPVPQLKNGTDSKDLDRPFRKSIWSLINDQMTGIVSQAVNGANDHFSYSTQLINSFTKKVDSMLEMSFKHIPFPSPRGRFQLHNTIQHDVEVAVDESMKVLHMEQGNFSFRDRLIKTLDRNIEMNSLGKVISNSTNGLISEQHEDSDLFHNMPIKDEAMFIALVCIGVIVPIIFITLFAVFMYKKRRDRKERSQEMLLKDQPEFSMDEYNSEKKNDEDVPDLDLKGLRVV